jgi:hypothetical protein
MSTKVSALTAATNAELNDDSLVYVVTDPSGTPASKKSTAAKIGGLQKSYAALVNLHQTVGALNGGSFTIGMRWNAVRSGQSCTGVRVYWPGGKGALTLKLSLWDAGVNERTANVAVDAAGFYSVTFTSAYTLNPKVEYTVSCWETSGLWYLGIVSRIDICALPQRFRDYFVTSLYYYASADAYPNTYNGGYSIELEPLVSG